MSEGMVSSGAQVDVQDATTNVDQSGNAVVKDSTIETTPKQPQVSNADILESNLKSWYDKKGFKSMNDVVKSLQNAEKLIGKKAEDYLGNYDNNEIFKEILHEKLGIPKNEVDYGGEVPEDIIESKIYKNLQVLADENNEQAKEILSTLKDVVPSMQKKAKELGLTVKQYNALLKESIDEIKEGLSEVDTHNKEKALSYKKQLEFMQKKFTDFKEENFSNIKNFFLENEHAKELVVKNPSITGNPDFLAMVYSLIGNAKGEGYVASNNNVANTRYEELKNKARMAHLTESENREYLAMIDSKSRF